MAAPAVDASSPVIVNNSGFPTGGAVTTAAFDPPNGCLLVACVAADGGSGVDITITLSNNGAALTWTKQVERDKGDGAGAQSGHASIWTAPFDNRVGTMTVTATSDQTQNQVILKVFVVTGQHASPIGTNGEGSSTINSITPTVFNTTANDALVIGCASDWSDSGVPTSSDTNHVEVNAADTDFIAVWKAVTTSGTGATLNFDAAGAGGVAWNWVALEILPTTGGASPTGNPFESKTIRGLTFGRVLMYHRHPAISLGAYRGERARQHRDFMAKVRRAAA